MGAEALSLGKVLCSSIGECQDGNGSGWVGEWRRVEGIGDFQRGN